jgi:hypothetical protein
VRVFAGGGASFQAWLESIQDADLLGGEDVRHRPNQSAVASAEQLQDVRGGDQGQESKPLKRLRTFNLARLNIQPLRFKSAEKLFDRPASSIPQHHLEGFGVILHLMRRQQAPVHRLLTRGRAHFADIDQS